MRPENSILTLLDRQPAVARTLDRSARLAWRVFGRPVNLCKEHRWLNGPSNPLGGAGDDWFRAFESAGRVKSPSTTDGLLDDMATLDGPDFAAAAVDPMVRHFYEHTASWSIQAWLQWNPAFVWGGEAIARLWSRRMQQLAIPVQPMAISRGMSSTVRVITNESEKRLGAAWIRKLRSDGSTVFSGLYRSCRIPTSEQPHVHVTFPLENGNAQIFLAPGNDPDGSLWLRSGSTAFGGSGLYTVVDEGGQCYAAKMPLREVFHVYRDKEGWLRTDHWETLGRWPLFRLHYRFELLV